MSSSTKHSSGGRRTKRSVGGLSAADDVRRRQRAEMRGSSGSSSNVGMSTAPASLAPRPTMAASRRSLGDAPIAPSRSDSQGANSVPPAVAAAALGVDCCRCGIARLGVVCGGRWCECGCDDAINGIVSSDDIDDDNDVATRARTARPLVASRRLGVRLAQQRQRQYQQRSRRQQFVERIDGQHASSQRPSPPQWCACQRRHAHHCHTRATTLGPIVVSVSFAATIATFEQATTAATTATDGTRWST